MSATTTTTAAAADRALIEAETSLPGLALVLDLDQLSTRMARATDTPGSVVAPYLRYKAGTSCVLAATWRPVDGIGEGIVARDYSVESLAKLDKTAERARAGDVLMIDRARGLIVTRWSADRSLPALRPLGRPASRRRLADGLPTDLRGSLRFAPTLLRHNPDRRAVFVTADRRALLRAVRPFDVETVLAGYAALAGAPMATPDVLGVDAERGLVAVRWIDGVPLDAQAGDGALEGAELARLGAAVARMHAVDAPSGQGDRGVRGALGVRDVAGDAEAIAAVLPSVAPTAHAVAGRIRTGAGMGARSLVHGDLSLDQIVRTPTGFGLIDADSAGWGDPADDLASLVASMVRSHGAHAVDWSRAVLTGYRDTGAEIDPEVLASRLAAHLLRRAVDPFRRREPHWPRASRQLVVEAAAVLDGSSDLARAIAPRRPNRGGDVVRHAPLALALADRLATRGVTLGAVLPRSADQVLVVAYRDGELRAGRWDAGAGPAPTDGTDPERSQVCGGVLTWQTQEDPRLPALAEARRSGTLVAHRVGRRAVVRHREGYTKITRPGRERLPVEVAGFRTPTLLRSAPGTVTTSALPGRTLHDVLADPAVPAPALFGIGSRIGAALRQMQTTPTPGGTVHDADAELAVIDRWWAWALAHGVGTPRQVARLRDRVERALRAAPAEPEVFAHRDLHDKQILVEERPEAPVGLLDLDLATTAPAALDVANLCVHLGLRAHQGLCSVERSRRTIAGVLAGYEPSVSTRAALPAWASAARARLIAVYAFRPLPVTSPSPVPTILLSELEHPISTEES